MNPPAEIAATSVDTIRTVAIIGAGAAGRDFAALCLHAGLHVVVEDVMPANLRRAQADLASALGQLDLVSTVEDAVRDADIAIDFVPDELESKLEIFSMIDRMAPPRTILCTPSDALSISDLASCVYRPDLCFALGGLPPHPKTAAGLPVKLLFPPAVSLASLRTVSAFLLRLGFEAEALVDPQSPMLVKNLKPGTVTTFPGS